MSFRIFVSEHSHNRKAFWISLGWLAMLFFSPWLYAETQVFFLVLEEHTFKPSEITIPANQKVKLVIENKDDVAEEFDSFDLNRERVIFAGKKATIYVGPLPKGRYEFFGEYHPNSARGFVIAEDFNQ